LHATTYEYFDLRDDRTDSTNPIDHLGLMRDDYTPKPASSTYRRLIRHLR
jgi:hypothetical protein